MYDRASELSKMTVSELNNIFSCKLLKDFELGTVIIYFKLRYITIRKPTALKKVPVIAYR